MKKRIIGIDVARAFAIIGMIIVNFKIAFGDKGSHFFKLFASIFEGKASATFVVLAGVGIAFITNSAVKNNDTVKLKTAQKKIIKRALFLFIVGLLYMPIWMADILHFYGIYMLITVLFISSKHKIIFNTALLLILLYPILMLFLDYDIGWNYETYEYADFWSVSGFFRNLFYNGFHPVIPWVSFMLLGLWFGKQDLTNQSFVKKALKVSFAIFISTLLISSVLIALLSEGNPTTLIELKEILGTSPMPPLPIYMISGSSIAIFVISLCILIAKKYENNFIITALHKTGQLSLTFYVAHVLIGMGIIEFINPQKMGRYTIEFSVIYALIFSVLCILFAVVWTKYRQNGPLEWLIKKITK
ncbi:MAG: DUF418 domain-containing protein [Flavobacteriaceae bacterium]|nr:DUF418 domain-containing protein [Flavobacteriaceae bacterium]